MTDAGDWALLQAFTVDTSTPQIRGQGSIHLLESSAMVGPNCNPCSATVSIGGTNSQHVEFSLTESTACNFHSDNTVGQWIARWLWYEPTRGLLLAAGLVALRRAHGARNRSTRSAAIA